MGVASTDDPALADYWGQRRRKARPPIDKTSLWLLKAQDGRCAICGSVFLPDDDRPQNRRSSRFVGEVHRGRSMTMPAQQR
jgi:hypothetical protein